VATVAFVFLLVGISLPYDPISFHSGVEALTISSPTVWENGIMELDQDLIVADDLILDNYRLVILNDHKVEVMNGATLQMKNGSAIASGENTGFRLTTGFASLLKMENSRLVNCTYLNLTGDAVFKDSGLNLSYGLVIFASGSGVVEDSTIRFRVLDEDYAWGMGNYGSLVMTRSTVRTNVSRSYSLTIEKQSHTVISDCDVIGSQGIVIDANDTSILNTTIHEGAYGVRLLGTAPTLENNTFWNNTKYAIWAAGGGIPDAMLADNTFERFGNGNLLGRVLHEVGATFHVLDFYGDPVPITWINVSKAYPYSQFTDHDGWTLPHTNNFTLYIIENDGSRTEPQYTANVSWYSGIGMLYAEQTFKLAQVADPDNITFYINRGPDLWLTEADVVVSDPIPSEGDVITVTVTVHNKWASEVKDVPVLLQAGPQADRIETTIASIPANETGQAVLEWKVFNHNQAGFVDLDIFIDPPESGNYSVEGEFMNRSNNYALIEIEVGAAPPEFPWGIVAAGVIILAVVVLLLVYLFVLKKPEAAEKKEEADEPETTETEENAGVENDGETSAAEEKEPSAEASEAGDENPPEGSEQPNP